MKLSHSINISAPRELVWDVTTDINNMTEWTPTVQAIERIDDGPVAIGSEAWIKQPGMPKARWTVTTLSAESHFAWETHVRGMHIIATHELAPLSEGTCNTLLLEFRGLSVWLMAPLIWLSGRRNLRLENEGLKRACEERASSQ